MRDSAGGSASAHTKWNLADEPQDYKYFSAGFYYTGKDEFGFLDNYMDVMNE